MMVMVMDIPIVMVFVRDVVGEVIYVQTVLLTQQPSIQCVLTSGWVLGSLAMLERVMMALVTFSCDTSVRFSTSSDITLSEVDRGKQSVEML